VCVELVGCWVGGSWKHWNMCDCIHRELSTWDVLNVHFQAAGVIEAFSATLPCTGCWGGWGAHLGRLCLATAGQEPIITGTQLWHKPIGTYL
jgi:hypothetical protein